MRRLYQQAVHEREQLKELERLKSQFLSLVSHELRTPLSSIKASAEVLLSTAPADARKPRSACSATSIGRATDSARSSADLLDLTRLEGGRLELHRERVDLRDVTDEALATVRPLADSRKQTLTLSRDHAPCPVFGDRRRLEQVALNLLTNAVKYGRVGGRIWLLVRRAPTAVVRLEVRDDGPGIRESEQRKVFERFYRPDTEITRRASGTGLGLPIARALHRASRRARSSCAARPGRGSTFVVTLPDGARDRSIAPIRKERHEDPDRRRRPRPARSARPRPPASMAGHRRPHGHRRRDGAEPVLRRDARRRAAGRRPAAAWTASKCCGAFARSRTRRS